MKIEPNGPCNATNFYPYGHRNAYRLDTSVHPPAWEAAAAVASRERWYPTAITMHDGRILLTGHEGQPGPDMYDCPPTPPWEDDFAALPTPEVREYFDGGTNTFEAIERHQLWGGGDCEVDQPKDHADYPRLHLLANGWLFHSNDHDGLMARTRMANVMTPLCAEASQWRWQAADNPAVDRHGGSSVHFVVRDPPLLNPVDVVYAIGGIENFGDAQCALPPNSSTDSVEKMIDPRPLADPSPSQWDAAPPLPYLGGAGVGRGSHNSVILLDGSILVVGGAAYVQGDQCYGEEAKTALRYYPPEVFRGIVEGSPDDVWHVMAEQAREREYHSVTCQLPDGRVISAGGETPSGMYSLEIYEPDYYFDVNRPTITDAPATMVLGDTEIAYFADATTCPLREVGRVVLLRNGSVTHGFDFHQRYVELTWLPAEGAPPDVSVQILPPEAEGFTAQPGWYLLVVIDDEDVPSEGRWIQMLPSTQ